MIGEGCNLLFSTRANRGAGGFTAQDRPVCHFSARRSGRQISASIGKPIGEDMTFVFASNNQYSSIYLINLGLSPLPVLLPQGGRELTLKGAKDRWEVALIGKNLNNDLTSGNCANSDRAGGLTGGQITGANTRGPAGVDEVGCYTDRGREGWVRLSLSFR